MSSTRTRRSRAAAVLRFLPDAEKKGSASEYWHEQTQRSFRSVSFEGAYRRESATAVSRYGHKGLIEIDLGTLLIRELEGEQVETELWDFGQIPQILASDAADLLTLLLIH